MTTEEMAILNAAQTCSFLDKQWDVLASCKSDDVAEEVKNNVLKQDGLPCLLAHIFYDAPLIRCCKISKDEKADITNFSRFSFPPPEKAGLQRMNVEHNPVFYAANDLYTALQESGIAEEDDFYMSVWGMADGVRMNTMPCLTYEKISILAESCDEKIVEIKKLYDSNPGLRIVMDKYAEIFSIPHKIENPKPINDNIYYLSGA